MGLYIGKKSKRIWKYILLALVAILLFNMAWFIWREISYRRYVTDDMKPTMFSSVWVPRYHVKDKEGYQFNVKYPNYPSFTGNLAITVPTDDPFGDSIIIWPLLFANDEYGIMIADAGTEYQIYIDSSGNAIDPEYAEIVSRHSDTICDLLQRAFDKWPALLSSTD